ncbi:hypothetical protein CEXT_403861 [Caerostris extrusa]|uniref:Uncharacterized protein n=1 Tax=Caerostris extrusa TaxID=172846 RepID=A0AAV4RQU5_CAEEX|nr:hypothetical protein CEXT_403861 [Caerostris extrusa]
MDSPIAPLMDEGGGEKKWGVGESFIILMHPKSSCEGTFCFFVLENRNKCLPPPRLWTFFPFDLRSHQLIAQGRREDSIKIVAKTLE